MLINQRYMELTPKTYGVPRLQRALRQEGHHHGKARISCIMKQEGLQSKAAKRFKVTTNSQHTKVVLTDEQIIKLITLGVLYEVNINV